jgi:hypothetical protein
MTPYNVPVTNVNQKEYEWIAVYDIFTTRRRC